MFRANELQKYLIWRAFQKFLTSNSHIEKYTAMPGYRFNK